MIVQMDRQKAALVVMGIKQRLLLMAMRDVTGVVDVEGNEGRRLFVRGYPLIDERICQTDQVTQGGRVLEPRQRRLGAKIAALVRQTLASELERRVGAQKVEIVGVLIAAADRENAGADHISEPMGDACRMAPIWKAARQPLADAKPALRHGEQHDAAVRGEAPAVEIGCDFLAADG
jgi:hypothetical protein